MRKIFTLALSAFMLGGVSVSAQTEYTILEDLTASKIQNADFSEGTPVGVTISTYDYNMSNVPVGTSDPTAGLFGMQAVPGWTANFPSDNVRVMENDKSTARTDGANAKAAGIFEFDDESGDAHPGLGGDYYAPYTQDGFTGNVLGMVAVWGSDLKYTQDATLPAGAYMMIVDVFNASGTGSLAANNIGFISENASYTSTKETYPTEEWVKDTIVFRLTAETAGQISLGVSFSGGSGASPHLFINGVKLYSIDEQEVIQAEIDKAKEELKKLIDEGEMYDADVKASTDVYNNPNATMDQVQAAIAAQKEINAASVTDLSEFFFDNPHFDADEPVEGGICTYGKDMATNGVSHYSMQPVSNWTANKPCDPNVTPENAQNANTNDGPAAGVFAVGSGAWVGGKNFVVPTTLADGSTDGKVLGFVTSWTATVQYTQACTLPAGQYKLSMSYYNADGPQAVAKNLIGFVANNGTEYLATTTTFPVGKWTSEEVSFELTEETTGYFTLGYTATNTGSGNMPHFFTDGIYLTYIGTGFNPSLFALKSAITTGTTWAESEEVYFEGLRTQMEELVKDAEDLFEADSEDKEANKAAAAAIKDLVPQIESSIAAYKNLATLQADLEKDYEQYDEENYPALNSLLGQLKDEVDGALDEASWNDTQIEEAIALRVTTIKEEIQKMFDVAAAAGEKLDNNLDITPLFEQMSYTYSTSERKGTDVPDKEWAYGDASNFKTQYGTAEVWNQSPFTVSRTLKDMPAGTYTLTTKAFYRTAANAANVDNYDPENELAFVFAGNNKTALVNSAELKSNESVGEGWSETADGSGIFVPNNQKAGYDIFNNEDYDAIVTKSVSTVLAETGDLTFGIKTDKMEGDSWVLWYGFTIEYNAPDADVLNEDLEALIEEFHNYAEEQAENMNDYEKALATDAEAAATMVLGTDLETMAAARKALVAAFEEVKAGVAAWAAYETAADEFTNAKDEYYDDASIEAQNAYDAIEATVEAEEAANYSAEELKEFISQMETAVADLKLPAETGDASDDNGVDMTLLIQNPSFEDGLNGWTYFKGDDTQSADNSNATYHMELAEGSYVFNTWSASIPADGLYVSQELKALPAGTYELQAVLASDKGNKIDLTANGAGMPFEIPEKEAGVELGEKNIGIEASIIFKLEEKGNVTIKASSKSWFKVDNFRLTYYGAESAKEETEIEDIEIAKTPATGIMYNLAGQQVNESYKGVILKDGKAYLNN